MKNIYLVILSVFAMTLSMNAQLTGGGKKSSDSSKEKSSSEKEIFKNSTYITFSRTSATGTFAEEMNNISDFEKGNGGMSKGIGLSFGSIFYLNSIDFHEQIKVGIDVTYISWAFVIASQNAEYEGLFSDDTHFFSVKVGPIISYNPVDRLLLDARITLQPTSIFYSRMIEDGYDEYGASDYNFLEAIGFRTRIGLGLNVRYRPFTLGFELSSGKVGLKDIYSSEEVTTMSTGRFDFVLGFSF